MHSLIIRTIAGLVILCSPLLSMAGQPIINVALQSGASTSLPQGATGTANYIVTLNANAPSNFPALSVTGGLPAGVTQVTNGTSSCLGSSTVCGSSFNLSPGGNCCLMLQLTASNMTLGNNTVAPIVSTTPATYAGVATSLTVTITRAAGNTTLTVPSTGTIPVNNGQGSLVVTNTGAEIAYNVQAELPAGWTGVTQDKADCATISPNGGTCTLLFSSTTAYVAQSGITVTGENVTSPPTTALAFTVDGYLVFNTSGNSIAYVIDTSDIGSTKAWDSSKCNFGLGTSRCVETNATSNTDGEYLDSTGNTYCIITGSCTRGTPIGVQSPVNAAGSCYNLTISAGSTVLNGTWYLPAIDELGDIYSSLKVNGFGNLGTGSPFYWSSTEYSGPTDPFSCPSAGACAWEQSFAAGGFHSNVPKSIYNSVRCAQAITY